MGLFDGLLDREEGTSPPWGGYDFSKNSLAVVAANDKEDGAVVWVVGGHLRMEMEEAGLTSLEDLGIGPPSAGIWIWEGRYVWRRGGWEHPEDGEMDPVGTHRLPTEEEWAAIKKGECPWDDKDWKLPEFRDVDDETCGGELE